MTSSSVADRSTGLARRLVGAGARVVVVGSTARRIRGCDVVPRDLDLVVDEHHRTGLLDALRSVGAVGRVGPSGGRVVTGWGEVDVFVGPVPTSVEVAVDDVVLWVADLSVTDG